MFDVSPAEILTLAFIALLVFGPDRLPEMAAKAGRFVRQIRKMAEAARSDLSDQLGPEFKDLTLSDLQPRNLVRKHLLNDLDSDGELRRAADLRQLGKDISGAAAIGDLGLGRTAKSAVANGASNGAASHDGPALPPAMQATQANAPAPFDAEAT